MSIKINNAREISDQLKEFAEEIKLQIESGIDTLLDPSIDDLKDELKSLLNGEIEQVEVNDLENKKTSTSIPKADTQILSELTDAKFDKLSKTKDFNTMVDNNIAVIVNKDLQKMKGNQQTTSPMSSGVNFRIGMEEFDTFDNQRARALDYFNNAVFVFEINGKIEYFMNPGIDLTAYIKIVCSREGGDGPRARERFEQHKDRRGYADWTLLAPGIDLIKSKFVRLTPVVEQIKNRDYQAAEALLKNQGSTNRKIDQVVEKLHNISDNKNIKPETKAYNNLLEVIANLKIRKTINENKTTYTLLTSSKEQLEDKEENFLDSIQTHIYLWKVGNEQKIVASISKAIERAVAKFNKR